MNLLRKKRGVSEVVSVVLIIMITVAAIAVLWTIVIPMISENLSSGGGCFKANAELTLVSDGYTCVNRASGEVSVHVKRGADATLNISGIQVIIGLPNGNSLSESKNDFSIGINQDRTFVVTNASYKDATTVSVAPVVLSGKTFKTCPNPQQVVLPAC